MAAPTALAGDQVKNRQAGPENRHNLRAPRLENIAPAFTLPAVMMANVLAVAPLLAQETSGPRMAWAPIVLLLVLAIGFGVVNVALSLLIGPHRTGKGKETTYESGMVPVGDTRQRFNVRFYIVAMIFLVFDVEIVFMYPWATIFAPACQGATKIFGVDFATFLLLEMFVFVGILLLAYFYAWGKGVFRWD